MLGFQQDHCGFRKFGMASHPSRPIDPIPVEGTFGLDDFGIRMDGDIAMVSQFGSGGGRKLPAWFQDPVFLNHPRGGFVGMAELGPARQLLAYSVIGGDEGATRIGRV